MNGILAARGFTTRFRNGISSVITEIFQHKRVNVMNERMLVILNASIVDVRCTVEFLLNQLNG